MFGRLLSKAKGAVKGGASAKYKIEVQVVQADGLPPTVKYARVVMSRSAKVAHTKVIGTRNGESLLGVAEGEGAAAL